MEACCLHTDDVTCPQCTSGGILRGTGNQKVGAIVNAVGYYVIGLPIGIALMFAAKLGVIGKSDCGKTGGLPAGPGMMAKHMETSLSCPGFPRIPSVPRQRVTVQAVGEKGP